jgi:hypothetical protein
MADDIDVGRFLRLTGTLRGVADSIDPKLAALAGDMLAEAYLRARREVQAAIPEKHHDEMDRLFPEGVPQFAARREDPVEQAEKFNAALGLLRGLAGWLQGFVEEAKMAVNAEALAAAKVKEERGVGIRPSQT